MEKMGTIVEYTDEKPRLNMYPKRIVSPGKGKACCARKMEQIGGIEREGERSYFYRRCKVCGYTVRHFLSAPPPDPAGGQWEDGLNYLLKLVG
jgi:hypothetical protein